METSNKPKEVLQSYLLTSAKYDFSIYEKRILFRIVEMLQYLTEGKKLNHKYEVKEDLFGDRVVTMPIAIFKKDFGSSDKNHFQVKKALKALRAKTIEYQTDEGWSATGIIEKPKIGFNTELVSFRLDKDIYDVFLNFSKGFSKYELSTAMKFESVYSMRFYELLYNQKHAIDFTIEYLKEMFQLKNKYSRPSDFILNVVEIAKKELDNKSHFSFNYTPMKQGRKIHKIRFYPIKTKNPNPVVNNEKKDLIDQYNVSLSSIINYNVIKYLKNEFGFSDIELKNNLTLLEKAEQNFDLLSFLSDIKRSAKEANSAKAYIIGAIKKKLE